MGVGDLTFDGKVVAVTGAASGMGKAVSLAFLEAGARVVLGDLNGAGLAAAVAEAGPSGERALTVVADVTKRADCEALVAATTEYGGRLDVLVNSAGVWSEGPSYDITDAEWDRLMDVNLRGVFNSCRAAIPALKQSRGCIVNIGSRAGDGAVSEVLLYCVSKAGVNMLTRVLALELAPSLVRVNAVCPSDVDTPFLDAQARDYGGDDPEGYLAALRRRLPQGELGRFVKVEEVAALVLFLSTEAATPITGECIRVDFGINAR
jgi:NAD(P)-dependent dehydrogenase (short-subunit alcohol dehydrogenase family)